MTEKKRIPFWLIMIIAIVIAVGGGAFGISYTINQTQIAPQASETIGGGFRLLSPSDSIVNDSIFRGKWMFMYFGASRCLDNVCSKNIEKMGKVVDLLGSNGKKIAPIFISYDTDYDTPSRLMLYMKNFNSRIIALTGGNFAIRDVSILYHAPIKKVKAGEKTELIDPFDQFVIMDPSGKYKTSINVNESAEQIANTFNKLMQ